MPQAWYKGQSWHLCQPLVLNANLQCSSHSSFKIKYTAETLLNFNQQTISTRKYCWVRTDVILIVKLATSQIQGLLYSIIWEHTLATWDKAHIPDDGSWWLLLKIVSVCTEILILLLPMQHARRWLLLVDPALWMSSWLSRQVIRRDSSSAGAYENGQTPEWGGKDAVHAIDKLLPRSKCQLASAGPWDLPSILEAAPTEAWGPSAGSKPRTRGLDILLAVPYISLQQAVFFYRYSFQDCELLHTVWEMRVTCHNLSYCTPFLFYVRFWKDSCGIYVGCPLSLRHEAFTI